MRNRFLIFSLVVFSFFPFSPAQAAISTLGGVNIVVGQPCPQNGDTVFDDSVTHIVVCTGGVWTAWGGAGAVSWPIDASGATNGRLMDTNSGANPFFRYNTATTSIMIGYNAGKNITDDDATNMRMTTILGSNAGQAITSAIYTTLIGSSAGRALTTGQGNTIMGVWAGSATTSGSWNVFIGNEAGHDNVSGSQNTFIGAESGYYSKASSNTYIGMDSGRYTTSGASNTYVGVGSGYANTTGANGVFIGYHAGYNTSGVGNVFLGYQAGTSTTTGGRNLLLGYNVAAPAAATSYYINLGNVIYGTTGTSDAQADATADNSASLRVDGSLQLGTSAETCNASNGGRMRYNSSTKKMQYCNETAWTDM